MMDKKFTKKHRSKITLILFKILVRIFYPRYELIGKENLDGEHASIFVCNHSGANGPISMGLYFPLDFKPWVIHDLTTWKTCVNYIEKYLFFKDLKIRRPFSRIFSVILAPMCLKLMKDVKAIPAYRDSIKTLRTFKQSVQGLENGYNIVIFPENKVKNLSGHIYDFYQGFALLAKRLYKETGEIVKFFPVFIDAKERKILIGKHESIDRFQDYESEKERLINSLMGSINSMAKV